MESVGGDNVTLLIKRKFLNKIKSGEKRFEYRNKSVYYDRLFKNPPKEIKFLCQHEVLVKRVKGIDICWGKYRLELE